MITKDIEIKEGKMTIIGGDFFFVDSDQAHIETIIKAPRSAFFENPLLGVGIIRELNGSKSKQELKQDIRRQLVFDNYEVEIIKIEKSSEISINATRLK